MRRDFNMSWLKHLILCILFFIILAVNLRRVWNWSTPAPVLRVWVNAGNLIDSSRIMRSRLLRGPSFFLLRYLILVAFSLLLWLRCQTSICSAIYCCLDWMASVVACTILCCWNQVVLLWVQHLSLAIKRSNLLLMICELRNSCGIASMLSRCCDLRLSHRTIPLWGHSQRSVCTFLLCFANWFIL